MYKFSGHSHKCNTTFVIQVKCDGNYGIIASKRKSMGPPIKVKKKRKYFKRHVKVKCNSQGKLRLRKIPKCISLKNKRSKKKHKNG